MPADRLLRILRRLEPGGRDGATAARLCEVCADVMRMTGAGIMLMAGDVPRGTVCSSDAVSASIEDFQFTLGEGPCVDAYAQGEPVMEEDLAEPDVARWIAFSPRALDVGARAVFGYPLRVGAVCIGAMNLYRDRPGPLDDEQHLDGLVLAGVAARAVLTMQSGAQPGLLGAGLEVGSDFRFVVHQACGMVSAQLEVGVGEALARLRAYAFAQNRLLTEVAGDVVNRSLRFE